MSIAGKNTVHLSKKDIPSQKTPAIGFKKLKFAHKATVGDTTINLNALVLPPEMPSFLNPSPSELNSANLLFNKPNLLLVSSLTGVMDFDSYTITGNMTITLSEAAADGEMFTGYIDYCARTGVWMADANPIVTTGVLLAGQTDFIVNGSFRTNQYPGQQHGAVIVHDIGQLLFRNTGNGTAGVGADGHYQEVDNGNGYCNVIRFNVSSPVDRMISVVSHGMPFVIPPDSFRAMIETLAGQLDIIIPDLALATGNPSTKYQSASNNVDQAAFGNRVLGLEEPGSPGVPKNATTSVAGAVKRSKWQRKNLTATINTTQATVAALSFNNLVIGRTYRLTAKTFASIPNGSATEFALLSCTHNTNEILNVGIRLDSGPADTKEFYSSGSIIFVALTTTINVGSVIGGSGALIGSVSDFPTFTQLEELGDYDITTDFT